MHAPSELPILLGSASPRRRELLGSAGVAVLVTVPAVDEGFREGESPAAYLERVVLAKVDAARSKAAALSFSAVLAADTIVAIDGAFVDKPASPDAARAALRLLSGRTHEVLTRFVIGAPDRAEVIHAATVVTRVTFRSLAEREIEAYVAAREGFDKAGGYGIQGGAAGFVTTIEGSYTNVVGLPLAEVVIALRAHGLIA